MSVYIGTAGTLYMYYRLALFAKRTNQVDLANMYLMKALELYELMKPQIQIEEQAKDNPRTTAAFYMGTTGFRVIGALLHKELGEQDESNISEIKECIEQVVKYESMYRQGSNAKLEDEILYGSAGYLYCLLQLKLHFPELCTEKIDEVIKIVVFSLVDGG